MNKSVYSFLLIEKGNIPIKAFPFFHGEKVIHKAFDDPNQFTGSEEEIMKGVRRVREEIKEWIKKTFA
ncbi:MAG: hypothetical protein CW716_01635 [Candidatus Bathyarchaeum sp.]|nr:MAG: hypothetical protein CW716_01635 [Candidatus Bathyarchaeum sp.]